MDARTLNGSPVDEPERDRAVQSLAASLAPLLRRPPVDDLDNARVVPMDEVQEAVQRFTGEWRASGAPPERVLVAVKSALRMALPEDPGAERLKAVTRRAVQWCIASYFRAD